MSRCQFKGTVIGTIASVVYVEQLLKLAASAQRFGFGCVVTLPFDATHAVRLAKEHAMLHALPAPDPPLLPRPQFCNSPLYGWRRTHLQKMRLWRHIVVDAKLDLLSVDANYQMTFNPIPTIHATVHMMPPQLSIPAKSKKIVNSTLTGLVDSTHHGRVDVTGVHDGPRNKMINIGLLWIRSTPHTRMLVLRTENRTWAGWDQYIFTDELNFNPAFDTIGCCVSILLKRAMRPQSNGDAAEKSDRGALHRRQVEGLDTCSSRIPLAAPALPTSRFFRHDRWNSSAYNPTPGLNHRREGRCTRLWDLRTHCVEPNTTDHVLRSTP